jgi:hypothetical protein
MNPALLRLASILAEIAVIDEEREAEGANGAVAQTGGTKKMSAGPELGERGGRGDEHADRNPRA